MVTRLSCKRVLLSGRTAAKHKTPVWYGYRPFQKGVQGMRRFPLVIALALGLLAASALPAIADEHVAKRSNWSHDRTKVYTTTAVNQHNQYGDLQGILKFRQGSALSTGDFDIQIDYVRLYRVLPDRSGLLVVEDNPDQNLPVTETWTYVDSGWQACGPNLPIGWYYAVSRFQTSTASVPTTSPAGGSCARPDGITTDAASRISRACSAREKDAGSTRGASAKLFQWRSR